MKIPKVKYQLCPKECRVLAQKIILSRTQRVYFPDAYQYLSGNGGKTNIVKQLNLHIEDGLIKCRGRMEKADLSNEAGVPMLLPHNSNVVKLLIFDVHVKKFHMGVNSVMVRYGSDFGHLKRGRL